MKQIAIVDYGLGNLHSVERALSAAGAAACITTDPVDLAVADGVVVPGVGAFGEGIQSLERSGLADVVKTLASSGKPVLGICLGMQLLMDASEELGHWTGLGLIPGRVVRIEPDGVPRAKVPQIGWNTIEPRPGAAPDTWQGTILDGVEPSESMYFVHSYCVLADEPVDILAETEYAGSRFCSVVTRANVAGCQFHPEKSGAAGLRILRNFLASVPALDR
jgi:glutamine amidotransferase